MASLPSPATCALALALSFGSLSFAHAAAPTAAPQNGLLFYLSGDQGTRADIAAPGTNEPNFQRDITLIPQGAKGAALSCANTQLLSYWAQGNIYSQRGTLSFFWRSRDPVGPTEFPVFRVGYADHSSWDMVWLRIDYNGHGFDAFVTDINLARTRVSVTLQPFPKPDEWVHLALAWDETRGIRFYINGKLAAEQKATARYDAALDQFGPHSRVISPYQVQSDYNFARGGDIDEVRIYDRMLSDDNVAILAKGDAPTDLPPLPARTLADQATRDEWYFRYGWNRPDDPPPYLAEAKVSIRKVEIHDAYDLKRWYWKACDGIRETTWPGVYNRSRLPGRNDYFQLPDWDCYVGSGQAITFTLPNEPWNHVEISGAPAGEADWLGSADKASEAVRLFHRPAGQEKTVNVFPQPITGGRLRFTNEHQEEPIGELGVYNVTTGNEPAGTTKLAYRLTRVKGADKSLEPLTAWIAGRYAPDERTTLVAQPAGTTSNHLAEPVPPALPIVHLLIPNKAGDPAHDLDAVDGGLDGIAFDLPALKCTPTHNGLIALNIQVKDPLWPLRNMLDFNFSVQPGEAKTLWLDLRDRLLPPGKAIYLTVASSSPDFGPAALTGAELRLVFKPKEAARAEHELDRFTQARDCYAMIVEEHPHSTKLNLWNSYVADLNDLMRVNPNHSPGKTYYDLTIRNELSPIEFDSPPAGVPLWAFRQVELLGCVKHFVNWWIDHRQVDYGDFGGGISDDVDLLNMWPGVALMGCTPEKILQSDHALLEAAFKNGMFTHGLPTIQADYLHSYEEGINCLGQNLILDFGNPQQIERAMVTARGVASLTDINEAGHRHFRTSYFNGKKMAEDSVWGSSRGYSYLVLQPGELLVDYNGNPEARKIVTELADGLLAHRHKNAEGNFELPSIIYFKTDKEVTAQKTYFPWPLFWSAYKWTGDRKYLDPIFDLGISSSLSINPNLLDLVGVREKWTPEIKSWPDLTDKKAMHDYLMGLWVTEYRTGCNNHFLWQITGDKKYLEQMYELELNECKEMDFINTEGSLWIDRVGVPNVDLQRARLGGVALIRNGTVTGHVVSWKFQAPANDQSVAILIPNATRTAFKVIAYNLDAQPVRATMTGWNIDPGIWEITQGVSATNGDEADRDLVTHTEVFECSRSLDLTLAPHATTILTLKLQEPGLPYWQRPDLGISKDDVKIIGRELHVRVHSLGAVEAPATKIVFRDVSGKIAATAKTSPLTAPADLQPKTTEVVLTLPDGADPTGGSIEIDPEHTLTEITQLNNIVRL